MGMETPIFRKAGDVIESVIAWDVLQISARRLLGKKDFKEHQTIIKPYRAPPNSILGPHERSKPHMKLPFEGGNVTAVLPTSSHYSMQKGCSLWQSQTPQLLSYSYQCIRKVHEHQPDIFHSSFWACWACILHIVPTSTLNIYVNICQSFSNSQRITRTPCTLTIVIVCYCHFEEITNCFSCTGPPLTNYPYDRDLKYIVWNSKAWLASASYVAR